MFPPDSPLRNENRFTSTTDVESVDCPPQAQSYGTNEACSTAAEVDTHPVLIAHSQEKENSQHNTCRELVIYREPWVPSSAVFHNNAVEERVPSRSRFFLRLFEISSGWEPNGVSTIVRQVPDIVNQHLNIAITEFSRFIESVRTQIWSRSAERIGTVSGLPPLRAPGHGNPLTRQIQTSIRCRYDKFDDNHRSLTSAHGSKFWIHQRITPLGDVKPVSQHSLYSQPFPWSCA